LNNSHNLLLGKQEGGSVAHRTLGAPLFLANFMSEIGEHAYTWRSPNVASSGRAPSLPNSGVESSDSKLTAQFTLLDSDATVQGVSFNGSAVL
jgi:hypothetical protein